MAKCEHYQGVCLTHLVCPREAERRTAEQKEVDWRIAAYEENAQGAKRHELRRINTDPPPPTISPRRRKVRGLGAWRC